VTWRRAALRSARCVCSVEEEAVEEREQKARELEGRGDGRWSGGGGTGEGRGGVGGRLGEDGVRAVAGEDARASAVGPGDTEEGGAVGRDVDGAGCVHGPRMAHPCIFETSARGASGIEGA
jgi:hypothetical protein